MFFLNSNYEILDRIEPCEVINKLDGCDDEKSCPKVCKILYTNTVPDSIKIALYALSKLKKER